MDIEKAIEKRCSMREYKDKDVPADLLGKVLQAGRLAPSSGNIQNWGFVLVLDKEKKEEIAKACIEQYWMVQAPVFIVILGNQKKAKEFYGERGEKVYSFQNCAMAAENMMLEAVAVGLSTCFVGAFVEDRIRQIINAPEYMLPMGIITLGYAKAEEKQKVKSSLYSKVSFNEYGNKIKDMDLVLKNYNVVGKVINKTLESSEKTKKTFKDYLKQLADSFKWQGNKNK